MTSDTILAKTSKALAMVLPSDSAPSRMLSHTFVRKSEMVFCIVTVGVYSTPISPHPDVVTMLKLPSKLISKSIGSLRSPTPETGADTVTTAVPRYETFHWDVYGRLSAWNRSLRWRLHGYSPTFCSHGRTTSTWRVPLLPSPATRGACSASSASSRVTPSGP